MHKFKNISLLCFRTSETVIYIKVTKVINYSYLWSYKRGALVQEEKGPFFKVYFAMIIKSCSENFFFKTVVISKKSIAFNRMHDPYFHPKSQRARAQLPEAGRQGALLCCYYHKI